jgi:hypothetical protein
MSLDFTLYRFADYPLHPDTDVGSLERLPLGTVAEVRGLISVQLPGVEWESFYTGYLDGDGFRLDFFVGSYTGDDDDTIDHLDIAVHGHSIDSAIDALLQLAGPNQWAIQESMEGQLILP